MTKPMGTGVVELDLDSNKLERGLQRVHDSMVKGTSKTEDAFKQLGIKSDSVYEKMRVNAELAYNKILSSARSTADDRVRAEQAMAQKIQQIHEQQYGVQKSLIDKIKSHWVEATVAMAAAAAAISLGKTFLDAGIAAESMSKGLSAALGSVNAATDATKFLRAESERLGLVFMDQVASYKSLAASARGTSMEGAQTQKIFTAITTASTALGLSADQTSGALNAIQQMMAKGTVQSEELRGQLSERLPGAFGMAAEAMGMTTMQLGKALQAGEVLATDMLPKLADVLINRYAAAATEAATGTQASINKMSTAWTALKVELVEDTMPAITKSIIGLTSLMKGFGSLVSTMKEGWAFSVLLEDTKEVEKAVEDVVKAKTEAQIQSAAYSSHILRETDSIQQYVDMSEEREKAEKKAAAEAKKAANEIERQRKKALADAERHEAQLRREESAAIAYNQVMDDLHSKIAAFRGDTYGAEIAKIEKEFERIAKTTGEANEELIKWNELARAAAGLKSVYDVVPEGKTSPFPDDPERRANEVSDAYRNMYTDMKNISAEYYDFQFEMIDKQAKRYAELGIDEATIAKWVANQKQKLNDEVITSAIQNAGKMFDVASSLYDKESSEYQKLQDLKKAAQIAELAMEVQKNIKIMAGYYQKMIASTTAAAAENAANASTAITGAVSSVAAQGSVPIAGFGLAAAMAAVMAGVLGIAGIAFSPGMSATAATAPTMQGASGVLGAESGVGSESIKNSMELLQDTYDMEDQRLKNIYNEMVALNHNITAVVTSIARTGGLTGISFDSTTQLSAQQSAFQSIANVIFPDFLGKYITQVFTFAFGGDSKTTLQWTGIEIGKTVVGSIMQGVQLSARQFASFHKETSGGLFGGGGSERWTEYYELNPQVKEALTKVFRNMSNTLVFLAEGLGVDVQRVLDYTFKLTQIDLKGMNAEQMNKALNEVFSGMMDTAVNDLFGNLIRQYQELNEGLAQTAIRLINDMAVVGNVLEMTNQSFGAVDTAQMIAFTEAMIGYAGGLKQLTEAASAYFDNFFSDAEKQQRIMEQLQQAFAKLFPPSGQDGFLDLGTSLPQTREEFRKLIESLNLTTESGRKAYAILMGLAGLADKYYDGLEAAAEKAKKAAEDAAAAAEANAKYWANALDYYNGMMGNSSGLSNSIKAVNDKFDEFRKAAKGLSNETEALTIIQQHQADVITKIISDWARALVQPLMDLGMSMYEWDQKMTGMTKDQIALSTLMEYRKRQGLSARGQEDVLNFNDWKIPKDSDKIEAYVKELVKYGSSIISAFEATVEALLKTKKAIADQITGIEVGGLSTQGQMEYYRKQAVDGYTALKDIPAEFLPEAIEKVRGDFTKYYDLEKQLIKEKYDASTNAINKKHADEIANIQAVRDKLLSFKYGSANLALPTDKAMSAAGDYNKLFTAAQTGDPAAVSKYLSFTDTAIQLAKDAYKSSGKYQTIYAQIMQDIGSLDTKPLMSVEDLTKTQNDLIADQTKQMTEELRKLDENMIDYLETLSSAADNPLIDTLKKLKDIILTIKALVDAGYGLIGQNKAGNDVEVKSDIITVEKMAEFQMNKGVFAADGYNLSELTTIGFTLLYEQSVKEEDRLLGKLNDIIKGVADWWLESDARQAARNNALIIQLSSNQSMENANWAGMQSALSLIRSGVIEFWVEFDNRQFQRAASIVSAINAISIPAPVTVINNILPPERVDLPISGNAEGYVDGGWPSGPDSGYLAMLHGKEVVLSRPKAVSDVNSSKSNDETNALLRTLIAAVQEGKIIAIDGKPIAKIADQNRINANRRPGNAVRRIA